MIVICGCGGTGSNLAPMLSRMLNEQTFVLIDGDIVENKNIKRQTFQEFDIGQNKARALAKKLNSNFSNEHLFIDKYLETADEFIDFIGERKLSEEIIICGCVDNNSSRLILEKIYRTIKEVNEDVHYIDSGNEDIYGTILVDTFRSSFMEMSEDDHPLHHCGAMIAEGNLQQYQTNLDMALAMAKVVFAIEENKEYPEAIKINGFERLSIKK